MKGCKKTKKCISCRSGRLHHLYTIGNVPAVNSFLEKENIKEEVRFPLSMVLCKNCSLVQLEYVVDPKILFKNYQHLSSASNTNIGHLEEISACVCEKTRCLDIGSNDGTLLEMYRAKGAFALGVDPALNLLSVSNTRCVTTIPKFFNLPLARNIYKKYGKFDQITALNVVAHSPDFIDILLGIKHLLSADGVAIVEFAYIFDTLLRGCFDTTYHEHVSCFSLTAFNKALKRVGLCGYKVEKLNTQGGSLRVFIKTTAPAEFKYSNLLKSEMNNGVFLLKTYRSIPAKILSIKTQLEQYIQKYGQGNIVALGAPARGVVLLNACNVSKRDIKYVVDDTFLKQGRLIPGVHIPVEGWERLEGETSNVFLLLSWNYKKEILNKLRKYVSHGKLIIPMPELTVEEF